MTTGQADAEIRRFHVPMPRIRPPKAMVEGPEGPWMTVRQHEEILADHDEGFKERLSDHQAIQADIATVAQHLETYAEGIAMFGAPGLAASLRVDAERLKQSAGQGVDRG
jgi:hypothetical protein